MKKYIIESANVKSVKFAVAYAAAAFAAPFYAPFSCFAAVMAALFWSVFGPAARYNFANPEYAYPASLKP